MSEFDPNTIRVSERARAHLKAQIARSGMPFLRLGVKESGCNGYMYTLDHLEAPSGDDREFVVDADLSLFVSAADLALVRGTEVDYVTEGLNSSLKFKNPNAESHCGCGESFSVSQVAH
ncbi:MAG: iron-sulfur cluster assembly accessory protein [Pseudomonadales bacterium]